MLGPLHGEVYVHGTVDCLLQENSKANPREPLWTEFQTFTFYSLVLPSFRSLSLSRSQVDTQLRLGLLVLVLVALVVLVSLVGWLALLLVWVTPQLAHLPSTTAAF